MITVIDCQMLAILALVGLLISRFQVQVLMGALAKSVTYARFKLYHSTDLCQFVPKSAGSTYRLSIHHEELLCKPDELTYDGVF